MSKSTLSVRIPEDKHMYIRLKALHTGKQQQELVVEMIDQYQRRDAEYIAKFAALINNDHSAEGNSDES